MGLGCPLFSPSWPGKGDTYEEALFDVKSAIRFHIETSGSEMLELELPVLEAFIAETGVNV